MPTVDEEGFAAMRKLAQRSASARLKTEAEIARARADIAQRDYSACSKKAIEASREARAALGDPFGHERFERAKALQGVARKAFAIYRRKTLAAERAERAADIADRMEREP